MNNTKIKFTRSDLIIVCMIILSSLIYSFGFVSFVHSGNLFPGGYAGLSRLISQALEKFFHFRISFSVVYFTLNAITTVFVWTKVGHKFVIYSILWYTLASVFTSFLPAIPITSDLLLIAVFGGGVNGFALGIALRNNASSGGTDFIAIYLSLRFNRPTWNYIMAGNAVVLLLAGLMFGWNQALYSIIFQFVSTQVINTMHQRFKLTELKIITNKPDDVCQAIFHICRHGITKIPCEGGFTHKPHTMLEMAINTYQLRDVIAVILKVDKDAFITVDTVNRIVGNYYQKPLD